jgi:hypothetical protein
LSDLLKELDGLLKTARSFVGVFDAGVESERTRILSWIEENRSAIEIEPGENIYRDHFNSQSLIAFIKGENK